MSYAPEPSSVLRFDLANQRNHLLVYTLALLTALAGRALGVIELQIDIALVLFAWACASALAFWFLYQRGMDRRLLNPLWMANDIVLLTLGVYATGGINSPTYIWYVATASAAAFAGGRKAAWAASIGNAIAYIGLLVVMGQAVPFNDAMLLAITRMLFVFGASYFFLIGVADLQEKRLRVRQLEAEERGKVERLTELTQELADANRRIQDADKLKSEFLALEVQADPLQPALERRQILAPLRADHRARAAGRRRHHHRRARRRHRHRPAASPDDLRGAPTGRRYGPTRVRRHGPRPGAGEEVHRASRRARHRRKPPRRGEHLHLHAPRCARAPRW